MYFTYSLERASMGFPYSQTLQWNQRYSPSINWRNSLRWSRQCCPLQTRSRSLWAWWNRPGSIHSRRPQSSQSPCTSPQSCSSWLRRSRERQRKGRERTNPSNGTVAPVKCFLLPQGDRNTHSNT